MIAIEVKKGGLLGDPWTLPCFSGLLCCIVYETVMFLRLVERNVQSIISL